MEEREDARHYFFCTKRRGDSGKKNAAMANPAAGISSPKNIHRQIISTS
nr:hypothetical protein [Photobacterium rosenbergii]